MRVATITFDGLPANLSMCEALGANLDAYSDSFKPFFIGSHGKPIYIIVDHCHVEKLIRNTLASKTTIVEGNNKKIQWKHFEDLVDYGKSNGFVLTHKLTQRHLQWKKNIMKVETAVQTLSASTAESMEFLMNKGYKQFADAEPTIHFIRLFNDLFDIFNTKANKRSTNPLKVALNADNKNQIFELFEFATKYKKTLRLIVNSNQSKLVCKSRSKTGFIGCIINMESLKLLYSEVVENHH